MGDKRELRRLALEIEVEYRCDGGVPVAATLINISHAGICLRSAAPLERLTNIELTIPLDMGRQADLTARVIWSKQEKAEGTSLNGLEITSTQTEDYHAFTHFCSMSLLYPPTSR